MIHYIFFKKMLEKKVKYFCLLQSVSEGQLWLLNWLSANFSAILICCVSVCVGESARVRERECVCRISHRTTGEKTNTKANIIPHYLEKLQLQTVNMMNSLLYAIIWRFAYHWPSDSFTTFRQGHNFALLSRCAKRNISPQNENSVIWKVRWCFVVHKK